MPEHAVLERMLVDADPARTPRDAAPDPAARMLRDRIARRRSTARAQGARRWATGLVGAVAATVVAAAVLVPHGGAVAATPRPLDFAPAGSAAQIFDDAERALATDAGPAEPVRTVRSATWALQVDTDARASAIIPELSTLQWEPDLSGRMLVIAGEAYDPATAETAEISSSGIVSMDLVMKPGEFGTPVIDAPAASEQEILGALMAFGMPEDPTAFEVITAIDSILQQWTMTNAQEAQLLGVLESTDDVTALGTTTDRLGRDVAGLSATSADGAAQDVLLISLDTGRILGVETTSLVADGMIARGAVISYRLWDVDERTIG